MSHVTYPLYVARSVHIDKQFATLNQQNAQILLWVFMLQCHIEYSYMLPSTRDNHELIKLNLYRMRQINHSTQLTWCKRFK